MKEAAGEVACPLFKSTVGSMVLACASLGTLAQGSGAKRLKTPLRVSIGGATKNVRITTREILGITVSGKAVASGAAD